MSVWPDVDRSALPKPTRDIDQIKQDLDAWGYGLLRDALTADQVRRTRDRLEEQAEMEASGGVAMIGDGGNFKRQLVAHDDGSSPWQAVRSLLNKGAVFHEVVGEPRLLDLMEHMLGQGFMLSSTNAIVMREGSRPQLIHADQQMIGFPAPVAVMSNALHMITDFDAARGSTRIIPGSHTWGRLPTYEPVLDDDGKVVEMTQSDMPETIGAEGPAGTALVFDGRLWHGGGANVSGDLRLAVSAGYARPFMRQQDLIPLSLNEDVYAKMPTEMRALVGFQGGAGLGRIDPALGRTNVEVEWPYIGELHRDS